MSKLTTIEINGVKMQVDLRYAKRIDELRVGDRVKVLIKNYSDYKVHAGTIIGFEPFAKLPTIIVAYIEQEYNGTDVKFVNYNAQSKDVEIVKAIDDDALEIAKADVIESLESKIRKHEYDIQELQRKKEYFLRNFQAYWAPVSESRVDMETE
jgi:hypothetical protein